MILPGDLIVLLILFDKPSGERLGGFEKGSKKSAGRSPYQTSLLHTGSGFNGVGFGFSLRKEAMQLAAVLAVRQNQADLSDWTACTKNN